MVRTCEKRDRGQIAENGGGYGGTWRETSWKTKENTERNSEQKFRSVKHRGRISIELSKIEEDYRKCNRKIGRKWGRLALFIKPPFHYVTSPFR